MKEEKKEKGNTCGIIGLCVGWLIPIVGLILGIIALARGEKTKWIGIASIVVAVIMWIVSMLIMIGLGYF
jgi:uncharacterized membrane protein